MTEQSTAAKRDHKPRMAAIYGAMLLLLRAKTFERIDIGPGEKEGSICVGFHPGWDDGEFVIMSQNGNAEFCLASCDGDIARNLAASLMAFADWCDEEAANFFARAAKEKPRAD